MGSPGVVEGTQTIRYYWLALSWPWLLQPPRPNLRPLLLPRLMLIPGMDTTATPGLMPMVMDTGLMAMDTTTERGLLMPSPLLLLLLMLLLPLMLMPGRILWQALCLWLWIQALWLWILRIWPPQTLWLWILWIQALWLWILLWKEVCRC